ncbi:MAG TPA: hypothetical protein VFJ74_10435 [Gemmatimonadaceae bacterium]|nr:hypothetical protein [Gemmatimonadaceae bacterium]
MFLQQSAATVVDTVDSVAVPSSMTDSVAGAAAGAAGLGSDSFVERVQGSMAQVAEFVPAMLAALVILFAGYLLAKLVEKGTDRFLRRIRLNRMLERGGVMEAVERSGSHLNPTRVAANLVFWVVMLAVMMLASQALRLDALINVFSELVSYIPSIIAAIAIVLVGILLGRFVGGLIMASAGAMQGGPTLARVGRGGVIVIAVFMALQELGVATDLVTTAFAILFGSAALALALSFGLGNRELAGEITREWYERYRAERERIAREAAAADLADELDAEDAERRRDDAADAEDAVDVDAGVAASGADDVVADALPGLARQPSSGEGGAAGSAIATTQRLPRRR